MEAVKLKSILLIALAEEKLLFFLNRILIQLRKEKNQDISKTTLVSLLLFSKRWPLDSQTTDIRTPSNEMTRPRNMPGSVFLGFFFAMVYDNENESCFFMFELSARNRFKHLSFSGYSFGINFRWFRDNCFSSKSRSRPIEG
jgi:hypothetical protein